MPKFRMYFSSYLKTGAFLITGLITGCSLTSGHDSSLQPEAFGSLGQTSSWYEDQLSASDPAYNYDWQILLARSYCAEGELERAQEVLSQLRSQAITPLQGNKADIVEAQIKSRQGRYKEAYALLSSVNSLSLSNRDASYYYLLLAKTEEKLGKNGDAGKHYIALSELQSQNDSRADAQSRAILALCAASDKELAAAFKKSNSKYEKGFIEYALINHIKNPKSRERLLTKLAKKYPGHPVLNISSTANKATKQQPVAPAAPVVNEATTNQIGTIGVFLPLSGKYAEVVGNPTKLGILNSARDNGIAQTIKFYDTAANSVATLYKQAEADGVSLIIGPIIKSDTDNLLAQNPKMPVIALNEGSITNTPNTYFLSLSPEIDVQSAASKITADGFKTPMVIAPGNTRGNRITNSFNTAWYQMNGRNVNACYFSDINSLESTLKSCFTGAPDTDAVYIYGTANEASVIREYSKIIAGNNQEYYISSRSNNGVLNTAVLNSINGMHLGDEPWLLQESAAKTEVLTTLPKASGDTLRCFAIGYDSLNVALNLNKLTSSSNEVVNGLSGNIYISEGKIIRELSWVTIGK